MRTPATTGVAAVIDPAIRLRLRDRFQTRLLLWLFALSVATSAITGYVFFRQQVEFVKAEQTSRGHSLISNLAGQSKLGAYSGDRAFLMGPARRALLEADVSSVTIYDRTGKKLLQLSSANATVLGPEVVAKRLAEVVSDTTGRPLRISSTESQVDFLAPIVSLERDAELGLHGDVASSKFEVIGVAHLGLSTSPADKKLRQVVKATVVVSLIIFALGSIVALIIAFSMSRPVLALAKGADALRRGELGLQLNLDRKDELGLLAQSFDRMSAKLKHTVQSLEHLNKHLEEEVSQRTLTLRRSRDFISQLNVPLDLHTLLQASLDSLVETLGATSGVAYLVQPNGQLEKQVLGGLDPVVLSASDGIRTHLLQRVAGSTRAIITNPVPHELIPAERSNRPRTLVSAPIRFRERLQGIIILGFHEAPPRDQVDFLEHAGSQLAIAVSNAQAYVAAEALARELEQRNEELLRQRDQLQEVNRLKTEFLANMSHELRTPLNAVIGYAELMGEGIYGPVNTEQRQSLDGITESATNLLQLINEILDLSKVEAGKMTLELRRVDLAELVRDVVEESNPLVRTKPYSVHFDDTSGPVVVVTDRVKLRQILVNLLSNAIKFTAEGGVWIRLQRLSTGGIRIQVTDTGVGIRQEHLEVIFDEFRQLDGSSTRRHGGTGLGLAISRKLARLIGGEITVESAHGKGSTFSLILPERGVQRHPTGPVNLRTILDQVDLVGQRQQSGSIDGFDK